MTFIPVRKKHTPAPGDAGEQSSPGDQDDEQHATGQEQVPAPAGIFSALAAGVRGWWTWCSTRIGVRAAYGLHVVALWAAGYYSAWVTWAVTLALAAAVLTFIPGEYLDRLLAHLERPPAKTPADAPGEASADPLPPLVWKLIGDAPGVHRKTLTEVLARAAATEGTEPPTEAHVEAALTARGITLRPSVRDTRGKVNRGVHRDDLEAWAKTPSPAPADAHATDP